jgi:hypothetical protein
MAEGSSDEAIGRDDNRLTPIFPLGGRSLWLLKTAEGGLGHSPLLSEPKRSTPLGAGESEDSMPAVILWAMRYLRHGWFNTPPDSDPVRWQSGEEDKHSAVYVIDDGHDHCMVARFVGSSPGGCTYCLVTRTKRLDFEDVRYGRTQAATLFSFGRSFSLCGVVEGSISNVVRVAEYRRYRDVPADYLPPSTFIQFAESL